ncbi:MAG: Kae1-associated serine/threonine protein kinase [Candidatus Marsarchaeota archaeon]|nr:Kae1-associated serine/threonine protein kinase [Candidatus Marsarchaeota archaeon]
MYTAAFYGTDFIIKSREPKKYRIHELDEELRQLRTRREAKILAVLSGSGVPVPALICVGKHSIVMQRLDGKLLRDLKMGIYFYRKLGRIVRDMHSSGVAHGDLTPANIMLADRRTYIIDFGLAEITHSAEEQALDLLLMKRSISKKEFAAFLRGYSEDNKTYKRTISRLADIEKRGRYQIRTLA